MSDIETSISVDNTDINSNGEIATDNKGIEVNENGEESLDNKLNGDEKSIDNEAETKEESVNNNAEETQGEDELQKDKPPPSECDMGIEVSPYKIGRKEWEELYIAVLYTIKHKLGANSSGYSVYAEDLYEYAQEAFCMSDEDHRRFLSIAQDEKPPILVLNVTVVEAQ
ncbi:Protein unc-13-like protein D, partial [Stegodyphus mimosarum]